MLKFSDNKFMSEKYRETINIWDSFCSLHSILFEKTCDEYMALLASDIDKVQEILQEKEKVVSQIQVLESKRSNLIDELNSELDNKIKTASDLILTMKKFESKNSSDLLNRLNLLLIDIIEKIQDQNKKNQLFLNKAILSLKEMRLNLASEKRYDTYTAKGTAQTNYMRG